MQNFAKVENANNSMNRFGGAAAGETFQLQHGLAFPNYHDKIQKKAPPQNSASPNLTSADLLNFNSNSGSLGFSLNSGQNNVLDSLFASTNQPTANLLSNQIPSQTNAALPLNSYVAPSQVENNFFNPQKNYNPIDFLKNPNLTTEQRNEIIHLSILKKSGFFGKGQAPNDNFQNPKGSDSSHFTLNPKDLQTPIEHEIPKAQKIKEQIDFRRSTNQNELTHYSAKIANANLQANMFIPEVHKSLLNLQQFKEIIAKLVSQISMARDRTQTNKLQSQMQQASQGVDQNMTYIRNSLAQASSLQRGADQDFTIIKRIVGANEFGNVDYENASNAAYDLFLANETIKNYAKTAENVYLNTQTGTRTFNQGNNSLCFIKTGQQFWKNNPNEILPNLVNMSTQSGAPNSHFNSSPIDSDSVHRNGGFRCGIRLLQTTFSKL